MTDKVKPSDEARAYASQAVKDHNRTENGADSDAPLYGHTLNEGLHEILEGYANAHRRARGGRLVPKASSMAPSSKPIRSL